MTSTSPKTREQPGSRTLCPGQFGLPVQATVSAAIDSFTANSRRQMAHAEGQMLQIERPVLALRDSIDEAERSTWRR